MTKRKETLEEQLARALEKVDDEKLRSIVRGHRELAEIKANLGPQTKEELWEFFKEKYGIELVRVAVCPGHVSQLDFVWWIYCFKSVLAVFSRGYGKTSLVGLCEDANATFFPGYSSFTIGPGKDQGERKYKHLLPFVIEGGVIGGKELPHINRSIHSKTEYANGSEIEIALGGGIDNANGPRSNRLHRDELELMLEATRNQAANIPAGKQTRDGRYVPAHVVDTSTMKYAGGYIDREMEAYLKMLARAEVDPTKMDPIEAFELAIRRGCRPRKMLMVSCVFEIAAENPTCRSVPEDQRRARLIELGRDPDEICDCNTFEQGVWDSDDPMIESRPRTLEDVCQGRFFRSRGYQRFDDIQTFFLDNPRDTWEAEKECSQPSREGAYLRSYSHDRHGIKGYEPDPENGPIYTSTDWGSTDEHWTGWFQELTRQVTVSSYKGERIRTLTIGSKVLFAEHSKALLGNVENGRRVIEKEREWIERWPGWRVEERYHDNAGADAKQDWQKELGLTVVSRIRKDFAEEVKLVRTAVSGWAFFVDVPSCPAADGAFKGWRQRKGIEVRNEHTHCFPAGTMIDTECGLRPIEVIGTGVRVWTREGLRDVLWGGPTKVDHLVTVEHESGSISCTDDHRFWTQRGWVAAQDLRPEYDMLLTCRSSRMDVARSSGIEGSSSLDGQVPKTPAAGGTSRATSMDARPTCIERSGWISGAKRRLRDFMSITRISTTTTTWSVILSSSHMPIMGESMLAKHVPKDNSRTLPISVRSRVRQWGGQMFAKLIGDATWSVGKPSRALSEPSSASTVLVSSRQMPYTTTSSFAPTTVRALPGGRARSTMSNEPAPGAELPGWSTVTPELSAVPARVVRVSSMPIAEQVYDLHIDGHHEFIADGVLVHNSMAGFRYYLHNRRVLERILIAAGGRPDSRPVAGEDHDARAHERVRADERGASAERRTSERSSGRELIGVAGAEDSPLRSRSGSIASPLHRATRPR